MLTSGYANWKIPVTIRWRLWVWAAGFRVVVGRGVFGVWWLRGGMRFLVFPMTGAGMLKVCMTRSRGWRGSVIRGRAGFWVMWRGLMRGFLVLARVRLWRWIRSSGCFLRCAGGFWRMRGLIRYRGGAVRRGCLGDGRRGVRGGGWPGGVWGVSC